MTNGTATVKLQSVRRATRGRPWLEADDVLHYEGEHGPWVDIADENNLPLGTALYNPSEPVRVRLFTSARTRDPALLLRTRLERAEARRHADVTTACEAIDTLADEIIQMLVDITGADTVVHWKRKDGTGPFRGQLRHGTGSVVRFHHGRLIMSIDMLSSFHLAGLTAQLRAQRQVRRWARGRVLEVAAKQGGFSLQLTDAGAKQALALESEERLVEHIVQDAGRNGLADRIVAEVCDPHQRMRELDEAGERFDLLVLHPDQVGVEAKDLEAVRRRVFEAHKRALRLLDEGRLLITWPGATPLDEDAFEDVLTDAASRGRKRLQVIARISSGPDHPGLLGLGESRPATCWVLRVLNMG
jgi:23S rRNA G2069 N7-methylase RlmK/C1962 C5-methylase RlmI